MPAQFDSKSNNPVGSSAGGGEERVLGDQGETLDGADIDMAYADRQEGEGRKVVAVSETGILSIELLQADGDDKTQMEIDAGISITVEGRGDAATEGWLVKNDEVLGWEEGRPSRSGAKRERRSRRTTSTHVHINECPSQFLGREAGLGDRADKRKDLRGRLLALARGRETDMSGDTGTDNVLHGLGWCVLTSHFNHESGE